MPNKRYTLGKKTCIYHRSQKILARTLQNRCLLNLDIFAPKLRGNSHLSAINCNCEFAKSRNLWELHSPMVFKALSRSLQKQTHPVGYVIFATFFQDHVMLNPLNDITFHCGDTLHLCQANSGLKSDQTMWTVILFATIPLLCLKKRQQIT